MPKPEAGEKKDEYIARCIPILKGEGHEQDEAAAICYSMWEQNTEKNESIDRLIDKYLVSEHFMSQRGPAHRWPGQPGSGSSRRMTGPPTNMKCVECGKTFKKKIGPSTYEVKCPKCGSYDTEPA